MARHLVKQPDGRYALWSTLSDSFLDKDLTEAEAVQFLVTLRMLDVRDEVDRQMADLKEGRRRSVYSWEYCVARLAELRNEEHHVTD